MILLATFQEGPFKYLARCRYEQQVKQQNIRQKWRTVWNFQNRVYRVWNALLSRVYRVYRVSNAQIAQNARLRFVSQRVSCQTRFYRVLRFWGSLFKRAGRDNSDPDRFSNAIVAHLRFSAFDKIAFLVSLRYYRFWNARFETRF